MTPAVLPTLCVPSDRPSSAALRRQERRKAQHAAGVRRHADGRRERAGESGASGGLTEGGREGLAGALPSVLARLRLVLRLIEEHLRTDIRGHALAARSTDWPDWPAAESAVPAAAAVAGTEREGRQRRTEGERSETNERDCSPVTSPCSLARGSAGRDQLRAGASFSCCRRRRRRSGWCPAQRRPQRAGTAAVSWTQRQRVSGLAALRGTSGRTQKGVDLVDS